MHKLLFFVGLAFLELLALGYFTIFAKLGNENSIWIQALTLSALSFLFVAFLFYYLKRELIAWAFLVCSILDLFGIGIYLNFISAQKNQPSPQLIKMNQQTNNDLIQNALEKLECTNGDKVIVHLFNNPGTDRHSLSIQQIQGDLSRPARIIISADGRFIPPKKMILEEFLHKNPLECKNERYQNALGLFPLLEKHYEKEKNKYPH